MWNGLKKKTKSNLILLPSGMTEPIPKKLKLTHRYPMLVPSFVFLLCLVWDNFLNELYILYKSRKKGF